MNAADFFRVLTLQDYNTRVVLLGTLLFGACAGVVGAFMLLRKKSLVGDVASHAALPGIGLAYLILESIAPGTGKSPAWLLLGAAAGSASGLYCAGLIQQTRLIKEDAALGIVLSVFFGFGTVLLSVVQRLPTGSSAGLTEFVFGKAASLTAGDVYSISIASLILLATCAALFKEFSLLCFDDAYAATLGWPTRRLDLLLTSLVVVVAVIGMPSVGLLLVVAQLVIPPTAARFWTERNGLMTVVSGVIGAGSCGIGIVISAVIPKLAAGAVIVLAGTVIFLFSLLFGTGRGIVWRWRQQSESRRRIGQLDLLRACFEIVEAANRQASLSGDEQELTSVPITEAQLLQARAWSTVRLDRILFHALQNSTMRLDADGNYRLTTDGARRARRAARNHRLWELYLIHFAQTAPSRVDREADEIEHVLEPGLIRQLEIILQEDAERVRVPVNPHH